MSYERAKAARDNAKDVQRLLAKNTGDVSYHLNTLGKKIEVLTKSINNLITSMKSEGL